MIDTTSLITPDVWQFIASHTGTLDPTRWLNEDGLGPALCLYVLRGGECIEAGVPYEHEVASLFVDFIAAELGYGATEEDGPDDAYFLASRETPDDVRQRIAARATITT